MAPRSRIAGVAPTPAEFPPARFERGVILVLDAKVLRVDGPYVDISVAGESLRVLRSRLEMEVD